jgi:hypothetical protein
MTGGVHWWQMGSTLMVVMLSSIPDFQFLLPNKSWSELIPTPKHEPNLGGLLRSTGSLTKHTVKAQSMSIHLCPSPRIGYIFALEWKGTHDTLSHQLFVWCVLAGVHASCHQRQTMHAVHAPPLTPCHIISFDALPSRYPKPQYSYWLEDENGSLSITCSDVNNLVYFIFICYN